MEIAGESRLFFWAKKAFFCTLALASIFSAINDIAAAFIIAV
jgi:hypothetical protein